MLRYAIAATPDVSYVASAFRCFAPLRADFAIDADLYAMALMPPPLMPRCCYFVYAAMPIRACWFDITAFTSYAAIDYCYAVAACRPRRRLRYRR